MPVGAVIFFVHLRFFQFWRINKKRTRVDINRQVTSPLHLSRYDMTIAWTKGIVLEMKRSIFKRCLEGKMNSGIKMLGGEVITREGTHYLDLASCSLRRKHWEKPDFEHLGMDFMQLICQWVFQIDRQIGSWMYWVGPLWGRNVDMRIIDICLFIFLITSIKTCSTQLDFFP